MENHPRFNNFINKYWGEIFFVFYFAFISYYYLERTLFLDNAFQTFLLIQDGFIEVNANRWPAVVYRVLPLLCVYLGLKLKIVLWFFSFNYFLVHFGLYSIVKYYCKDNINAILLISILSIPVVNGFFWCNSELVLALVLLVAWISLLKNSKYILACLFSFFLAWLHPLIIFPVSLVLLIRFVKDKALNKLTLVSSLIFYFNYFLKDIFFVSWYDSIKKKDFSRNLENYDFSNTDFGVSILTQSDWVIPIFLVLTVLMCIIKRKYLYLTVLLLFTFSYTLLLSISSGSSDSALEFYQEVNLYPLFFFSAFLLSTLISKKLIFHAPKIIIGIILFTGIRWVSTSELYTDRIKWYSSLTESNDRKVFDQKDITEPLLVMTWASAYESLVISSMSGESQTFIISPQADKIIESSSGDSLITEFNKYALKDLNSNYFHLNKKVYQLDYLD